MGKLYDHISAELQAFIAAQPLFFVASAPLSATGHVNLSPKGLDCLRVLSAHQVAYLDLTGSGNETSAHLVENGRITFMFCAFSGPPKIVRLYGQGRVHLPASAAYQTLSGQFPPYPGARQLVVADIEQVQTSCGFAVPLMDFKAERETLLDWAEKQGEEGIQAYQHKKNRRSLDALPTPLGLASDDAP